MATSRELRKRIKAIGNTAKITHAMELVAAAKMKRSQDSATAGKPYSQSLTQVLSSLSSQIDPSLHPLLANSREENGQAIIVFSTDRGLVGALNSNVVRTLQALNSDKGNTTHFISVGKKTQQFIVRGKMNLIAHFPLPERPLNLDVRPIAKIAIDGFLNGEWARVLAVYPSFESTLTQVPITTKLLPIREIGETTHEEQQFKELSDNEPLFEPDADTVLDVVLPHYIQARLYHILLETKASEHSARMVAMKNATENAKGLVDDLTLEYNRIRQAAITTEILDIATAQMNVG